MSGQDSQRRALEGTAPTTEVIKGAVTFPRERLGEPLDISPERFEAWLAQVRRDAAREALTNLAEHSDSRDGDGVKGRLGGVIRTYRDAHYPEVTP